MSVTSEAKVESRVSSHSVRRVFAVLLAAALGAGCSSAPSSAAPTAASSAAPNGASTQCDPNATITMVGFKGGTAPLDPTKNQGPANGDRNLIYDPLIRVTPEGTLQPGLATAWKWASPTVLDLTLRQGVLFHDGTSFNAAAVKANFDRGRGLPGASAGYTQPMEVVQSVNVVSEYNVQYVLKTPYPAFVFNLTWAPGMIISPAAFTQNLDLNAVGTGAFKLVKFTSGASLDASRNDQYWDKTALACTPKEFHYRFITDSQALLNGALSGQLNISYVNPDQVAQVEAAGLVVKSVVTASVFSFNFDYTNTPALKNPLVRQAMMYAVDRESLAKNLGLGRADATVQMFPPGFYAYSPDSAHSPKSYPYDPAKARQLLSQAGFPNGLNLKVLIGAVTFDETLAQAVQSQMKAANINLTIQVQQNFNTYLSHAGDMFFGTGSGRPDPLDFILAMVSETGIYNPARVPPPAELSSLTDKIALVDPTDSNRAKLLQQASGLIASQALVVPVMAPRFNWVLNRCIVNFNPPVVGGLQPLGLGWKLGCR